MHYAATSKHIFKVANVERLRIDPAGNLVLKDHLAQGNSLVNYIQANDVNGNAQVVGNLVVTGDVISLSDESKKENIIKIDSALDKIEKLEGVFYNFIEEPNTCLLYTSDAADE